MQNLIMDELVELVNCIDEERQQNPQGRIRFSANYLHKSFFQFGRNYDDGETNGL